MRVVAVPHQGVDAFRRGTRRWHMALAARLGLINLLAEFPVEGLAVLEDAPYKSPKTIVFFRIGQLFAADHDEAVKMGARRFQEDEQPLHVAQTAHLVRLDPRTVQKIDIAALEHGMFMGLHLRHGASCTDRRPGIDIGQGQERTGTYPWLACYSNSPRGRLT